MDGKHFPMKEYQVGLTAPPFHPNCRGTTCPYFSDGLGTRAARDAAGNAVEVPADMTYEEWKQKFVDINDESDIIEMYRNTSNKGVFKNLPELMSKKHIREIAAEFDVDLSGLKINIEATEELLRMPFAGSAAPDSIGEITFFPKAFVSEEELLRTLVHEREHVLQFREFGSEYVQNNRDEFEKLASEKENSFIEKMKKAGRL